MAFFKFSPSGVKSVFLTFRCTGCTSVVESEEISVPSPNYSADTDSDSISGGIGYAVCSNCKKNYEIVVYSSFLEGGGEIAGLPVFCDVSVHENSFFDDLEFEWEITSHDHLKIFNRQMKCVENLLLLETRDDSVQFSLFVMLYGYAVASTERFLSSFFIHKILNSDLLFRKFIETDPEFKCHRQC